MNITLALLTYTMFIFVQSNLKKCHCDFRSATAVFLDSNHSFIVCRLPFRKMNSLSENEGHKHKNQPQKHKLLVLLNGPCTSWTRRTAFARTVDVVNASGRLTVRHTAVCSSISFAFARLTRWDLASKNNIFFWHKKWNIRARLLIFARSQPIMHDQWHMNES